MNVTTRLATTDAACRSGRRRGATARSLSPAGRAPRYHRLRSRRKRSSAWARSRRSALRPRRLPALLRYIELAQPRAVVLNHGGRLAHHVERLGIETTYLEPHEQLGLF